MSYKRICLISLITVIIVFSFISIAVADISLNKSDEKYLTYPYNEERLERESVIINTDRHNQISKIYRYDDEGKLKIIHFPLQNTTLFVERYGKDGDFILAEGSSIYGIIGGTFDSFNTEYKGGAGLADAATEGTFFDVMYDITNQSIDKLEEAIKEYQEKNGRLILESEFNKPINMGHPLMFYDDLNLADFFDGHGDRLKYRKLSGTEFEIYSIHANEDAVKKEEIDSNEEGLGKFVLFGLLFIIGVPLAVIGGIFLLIKVIKKVYAKLTS